MIFYFTGTGNSKYIAEKIAEETGESLYNIADCVQRGQYSFALKEGETAGFVMPVYFMAIPIIAVEFLQKLKIETERDFYSYAVLNCGGTASNAEGVLQKAFSVNAIFAVVMADNYVPLYKTPGKEEIKECFDKAGQEIAKIIGRIEKREAGSFNSLRGKAPRLFTLIGYSIFKRGRKTKKFTVNNDCSSCGLCERICPRKAIRIESGKPVWIIPQCELCLGCLHRCPSAAINYGKKTEKNGRYKNPYVKL